MDLPKRKSIRLKGYDYSQAGCYFITICVKSKHELLGEIDVGARSTRPQEIQCKLSEYGIIVNRNIVSLPHKYPEILVDKYVVMPNHIHCIMILDYNGDGRVNPAPTISNIIGYFKYQTTKCIEISGFWQRSYYDHIIRNETEYQKIWHYIDKNPSLWQKDCYFNL